MKRFQKLLNLILYVSLGLFLLACGAECGIGIASGIMTALGNGPEYSSGAILFLSVLVQVLKYSAIASVIAAIARVLLCQRAKSKFTGAA